MRTTPPESKGVEFKEELSSQTLYDLIYFGALEQDKAKIDSALPYVSLTFQHGAQYSPVFKLASENTPQAKKALTFLLKTYPLAKHALLSEILGGLIEGRHFYDAEGVFDFYVNGAEKIHFLKVMIYQFALVGYAPGITKILSDHSISEEEQLSLILRIARGYARAGNVERINQLLARYPGERLRLLCTIAEGYAEAGDIDHINLLLRSVNPIEKQKIKIFLPFQYALYAYETLVKQLLDEPNSDKFPLLISLSSGGR